MSFNMDLSCDSVGVYLNISACGDCRMLVIEILFESWQIPEVLFSELDAVQISTLSTSELTASTSKASSTTSKASSTTSV